MSLFFRATGFRRPLVLLQVRRLISYQPHGLIRVQRVRIRETWFRRALWTAATYGIGTYIWADIALRPLDKLEIDLEEDGPRKTETTGEQRPARSLGVSDDENDAEEGKEDDEPIFIPLGLPRLVEGEPYTPNDPEWHANFRIALASGNLGFIKDHLVRHVLESFSRDPRITRFTGSPLQVRFLHLTHAFPYKTPPTYVRSGLEWSDDGFKWTSQPVTTEKGDLIWNVLEPLRVTASFIRAGYYYLALKRARLESFLNRLRFDNNGRLEAQRQAEESVNTPYILPILSWMPGSSDDTSTLQKPTMLDKPDVRHSSPFQPVVVYDLTDKDKYKENDKIPDLRSAVGLFLTMLRQSPGRYKSPPPGVFTIEGMITLYGPEGRCNVYAKGVYNPVKHSVEIGIDLVSLMPYFQTPRRNS
ncbi:hypothetical protein TESG_03423 [Trichophyton tonsurans CBS 112818]|uniref:Uncharacterized protein n=1 Tax=Trichophyton tonsurans (strain CBS 112818) TaxID=647933 RepID=F2RX66_TRIT1|nr:hypothetical protein TESG_03423 [Trichophyton tonsurans CBS 112818]